MYINYIDTISAVGISGDCKGTFHVVSENRVLDIVTPFDVVDVIINFQANIMADVFLENGCRSGR